MTTVLQVGASSIDGYGFQPTDWDNFSSNYPFPRNGATAVNTKVWIPFTVDLPQGQRITSAVVKWTATNNFSDGVTVDIGCDDDDDSNEPADWTELNAKVMTSAKLFTAIEAYVTDVEYSYTITASVQEVLDRPGWERGNPVAVMIFNNGTPSSQYRRIATANHGSKPHPQLVITYEEFIPGARAFL
jgi:hypothetical protein